jgi:UDP-N-acetylmuramate--alanine ligase
MQLFTPDDPRPIHFVGIAGAGMSALALLARRRGIAVTGCDTDPDAAADVVRAGGQVVCGHDPGHVAGARAVVYTAAVPADHPELVAARAAGIPVVRRAEALADAVTGAVVVGVSGTHGKTTTTVMTTEGLAAAGRAPTGLAGGRVPGWHGNTRLGGDELFVVEADEYDRSFLALSPTIAVVNNVEADHLECYGTLALLEDAFRIFAGQARRVLVGADDGGARRVAERIETPVWRVGLAADADVRVRDVRTRVDATMARVAVPAGDEYELRLRVPGVHNVRNAAMAVGVAAALDAPLPPVLEALSAFTGVGRRFELVGNAAGVTVVDDYAHHPTEVAATLAAARQRYPSSRLVAVFQPHLYSRTAVHGEGLGIALAVADVAVVTEIYAAREQPMPGVSGKRVADAARRAGAETLWVGDRSRVAADVAELVRRGDVVLTLGAGDITRVGPELLGLLRDRAA